MGNRGPNEEFVPTFILGLLVVILLLQFLLFKISRMKFS